MPQKEREGRMEPKNGTLEKAQEIAERIRNGKPIDCSVGPADEYILALDAEVRALRTQAQGYREALKPFAAWSGRFPNQSDETLYQFNDSKGQLRFTKADCIRAAQILSTPPAPTDRRREAEQRVIEAAKWNVRCADSRYIDYTELRKSRQEMVDALSALEGGKEGV